AAIQRAIRQLGLEGVVAKRRSSIYQPGKRTGTWVKVKFNRRQEFVVGGFKPNGANFDSLLVGYYEGRDLYFAGKIRAGFTPCCAQTSFAALQPIARRAALSSIYRRARRAIGVKG